MDLELEIQKQLDAISCEYPAIEKLYFDYVNGSDYENSSISGCAEIASSLRNQKLEEILDRQEFMMMESCCSAVSAIDGFTGFIHGFVYATRLVREIESHKEAAAK